MPDYKLIQFTKTNGKNELLIAYLDQLQFDSFEEVDTNTLNAYISNANFKEEKLQETLNSLSFLQGLEYTVGILENKNWNQEWEKNFKAIKIGDECLVRASFHPSQAVKYELVIEPKMAFGTGHHATTAMVMSIMLSMNFKNKLVLDFGCGTGILSLLAEKMGADEIQANDIEEPAYQNTIENAQINKCIKIHPHHGDIAIVPDKKYEIILANVTTNTIKENLGKLISLLTPKGDILLSGILLNQEEEIKKSAHSMDLIFVNRKNQENWVALHYSKS
ncbi:MAG: 50S ribosomal protein L11 methyltransferase [Chitinophagales bacterium]|jgi:ribosomal protein L11 methyltransferase|tara:strand:- start:53195 stop:54025 length:831 start_codon:yes stop_codon:yes gene_type:complete